MQFTLVRLKLVKFLMVLTITDNVLQNFMLFLKENK